MTLVSAKMENVEEKFRSGGFSFIWEKESRSVLVE